MNELVSMAQSFSGLPMDALIGGPLNAAATANAAMALTQTKFMLDTCFTSTGTGDTRNFKPIMINMTLTRGVIDQSVTPAKIDQFDTKFKLPLLSIIPLNSLAVAPVALPFALEVKSAYGESASSSTENSTKVDVGFEASFGWGPISATVKGNVSSSSLDKSEKNSHYDKSNSAKYTVSVHAGQLPLPKGVGIIIEAFAGAIQPVQLPAPAAAKP